MFACFYGLYYKTVRRASAFISEERLYVGEWQCSIAENNHLNTDRSELADKPNKHFVFESIDDSYYSENILNCPLIFKIIKYLSSFK